MKQVARYFFLLIFLMIVALMLHGCGSSETGTPSVVTSYSSCDNFANDGDTFTVSPADSTITESGTFTGGALTYEPLKYVLSNSGGTPRNGVCVTFITDGTIYYDVNYQYPVSSTSGLSTISLRTDDYGVIYVYWATETLPPAAATEQTGSSWVTATSGSISDKFSVTWTVKQL